MECITEPIGQILVDKGVLTQLQVRLVLRQQRSSPSHQPFGKLATRMFDVPPADIDAAWTRHYLDRNVRLDLGLCPVEEAVLATVSRRQAWQFKVVPVRWEGPTLVLATTEKWLPRAIRFAQSCLKVPVRVLVAPETAFQERLRQCYAWPAMDQLMGSQCDKWA